MTNEVAATIVPRPPGITVSDPELIEGVRAYLLGEDTDKVAQALGITVQKLHSAVRTRQWTALQNALRDDFMRDEGARLIRLQRKAIDRLEDYLDHGITQTYTDKETGQPIEYSRELTPKEVIGVVTMLNDTNKRLDAVREGDATRKAFNGKELLRDLERFAKAKTIDAEATGS